LKKTMKTLQRSKEVSMTGIEDLEWKVWVVGVNLDFVKNLNAHVYDDDHSFMFIILKVKDWLTCEERIRGARFHHLEQ
jgi:hypothetical protein